MIVVPAERAGRRFEERIDPVTGEIYLAVHKRGAVLLEDPILNKGTCFTREERAELGLEGIVPPAVAAPGEQEARAYENFLRAGDDLAKYLFLAALQDRNETLFYRLLSDHLEEMVPIVYTPTVGRACELYSHLYRRPRGLYVSTQDRGRIASLMDNLDRDDVAIIVVTDNEAILGIGDQGVGGMGIAVGKLALYTAGAGIHPARGLPLDFDIGTDNPALLRDPLYLGARHPRLKGDDYFAMLDELVDALIDAFPGAIVQWEDFANERAFAVLERYRDRLPSFDDDIQGTGAVVEAGIRVALDRVGRSLVDERVVFYGAGASGAGCALALRSAMRDAGVPEAELSGRVLCLDSRGLVLADRPGLAGHKLRIAADPAVTAGWPAPAGGRHTLAQVVENFRPTILVGASGQPRAFDEALVRSMLAGCPRPIVLALSNPTSRIEARPEDLLRWTNGAAVVGTGSPFPPVLINGRLHRIGQGNNALIFPGVGLGATAVGARRLPDTVFRAAARAVYEFSASASTDGDAIFPPLSNLSEVSRVVAVAVAQSLVDSGDAPARSPAEAAARVDESIWRPAYRRYRPA